MDAVGGERAVSVLGRGRERRLQVEHAAGWWPDPRDGFGHLGRSFLPDGAVRLQHDRAHDDDAWRPRLGPLEQFLVVAGQAHEPLRPAPAAADLGCVPGAHHGVVGPDPDEGAARGSAEQPLVAQPGEEVRHRVAGAPPVEQPVLREPPVEQRKRRRRATPRSGCLLGRRSAWRESTPSPLRRHIAGADLACRRDTGRDGIGCGTLPAGVEARSDEEDVPA